MKQEVLRIERGIKKTGISEQVLDFSIQIYRGELCGLLVENNFERRLLIDLLKGEEVLDYGWLYFEEQELPLDGYQQLFFEKIQIVNREDRLINRLKVSENVFLMHDGIAWGSRIKKVCAPSKALFEQLDCGINPEEKVRNLLPIQRKIVELIHAYAAGKRLAVLADMDEYFTEETMPVLYDVIFKLQKMGMDFLLISNNAKVLFPYTEYLYIFSQGRTAHRILKEHYSHEFLYSVILEQAEVADEGELLPPERVEILRFDHIETEFGGTIHCSIKKGEIVNFISEELESWRMPADVLSGEETVKSGKIYLEGKEFHPREFSDAVRAGVGIIEENPQEISGYCGKTILDNFLVLLAGKAGLGGFSAKYVKSLEQELMESGEFTAKELHQIIYQASAETIQKMAYFRWILFRPKVLVCLRPFSSSDYVIQKLTCYLMRCAQKQGITILIFTMSISEASIIGDRIIENKGGKLLERGRNPKI